MFLPLPPLFLIQPILSLSVVSFAIHQFALCRLCASVCVCVFATRKEESNFDAIWLRFIHCLFTLTWFFIGSSRRRYKAAFHTDSTSLSSFCLSNPLSTKLRFSCDFFFAFCVVVFGREKFSLCLSNWMWPRFYHNRICCAHEKERERKNEHTQSWMWVKLMANGWTYM